MPLGNMSSLRDRNSCKWYKQHSTSVVERAGANIIWYFSINTDLIMQANRPDITMKGINFCTLIDMSLASEENTLCNGFWKQIKRPRHGNKKKSYLKTEFFSLVVGALGLRKKGTDESIFASSVFLLSISHWNKTASLVCLFRLKTE